MEWHVILSRWPEYKVAAQRQRDKLSEAQLTDWQQRQFDRRAPAANA